MELEEAKQKMINYIDLFGNELLEVSQVENASSKEQLLDIIDTHYNHLSDMANDAQSNLSRFRRSLNLE